MFHSSAKFKFENFPFQKHQWAIHERRAQEGGEEVKQKRI